MKELLQFKKKRELGDILSDTFKFIRIELKPLFKALLRNVGIPFLILLVFAGLYAGVTTNTNFMFDGNAVFSGLTFALIIFAMIVSMLFFYGLMYGTVLNYIKLYIAHEGNIDQHKLTQLVKASLWKLIGLSILAGIMLFIGFMLCVLPGIYMYVPLSLVFAIMIYGNYGIIDAISKSFQLIKDEWWITFATLFLLGLLVSIMGYIFQVPAFIYMMGKGLYSSQEVSSGNFTDTFDWIYVLLNVLSYAVSFTLYIVMVVASAFIYFNLNERKNKTGTLEQIDSIGNTN